MIFQDLRCQEFIRAQDRRIWSFGDDEDRSVSTGQFG